MYDAFRRRPQFGTTDWAAQKIRALLDDEDRQRARLTVRAASRAARSSPATSDGSAYPSTDDVAPDQPAYAHRQSRPAPPPYLAFRQTPESRRALIDSIISDEGGYSNNPDDRGGPTKFGITQNAIDEYRNRVDGSFNQTPAGLSRDEAVQIYDGLIKEYRLDRIADPDLRAQVIDIMVNSGIDSAGKMLLDVLEQRGYDVRTDPSDNVIGSRTLGILRDLVNQRAGRELTRINNDLVSRRRAFLLNLLRGDATQEGHRKGWLDRADSFRFLPTGRQR
jgi:lysozyme family protein